jgi:uncharacterized membrane protein HdeD (DUF308 family)
MIIAGIIAMLSPWEAGLVITIVVGWSAIFNGVAQIIFGFRTHGSWHVILEFILGIIYIIAGIYLLMHPVGGLLALTLILAWFLFIYGVFALVLAFQMKPRGGWGWVLFDGIITILLGVLILAHWPINSDWIVGTLFGISIFISGITRLMMSLALRRIGAAAS